MGDNCTDSTNENYKLYWFNYFVSIGYITDSDLVNPYAPYGKCTRSLLWITYLINLIHFFLLSSGTLYILNHHRSKYTLMSKMSCSMFIDFRSKWILVAVFNVDVLVYFHYRIDYSFHIS